MINKGTTLDKLYKRAVHDFSSPFKCAYGRHTISQKDVSPEGSYHGMIPKFAQTQRQVLFASSSCKGDRENAFQQEKSNDNLACNLGILVANRV